MKRKATRTITMVLGIVVALGVVCSQLFYLPQTASSKKEPQTEQHQSDSDDQVHFSVPSTSLPSSAHVELNPNVFFLFEILFEENIFQIPEFKIAVPLGQFFRTVFGVTISPNAP
ncbi:hypothetical protein [Chryseolinea sp. H1M3-3]|uniref:hypothetical protein n=1 Tax=Chryseolinea sp. H1M3-3 TaxID=3034144 RepID=UPI0023EB4F8B|nr:hypothetical protein [Chryseolinea sp. H1M3-3]